MTVNACSTKPLGNQFEVYNGTAFCPHLFRIELKTFIWVLFDNLHIKLAAHTGVGSLALLPKYHFNSAHVTQIMHVSGVEPATIAVFGKT